MSVYVIVRMTHRSIHTQKTQFRTDPFHSRNSVYVLVSIECAQKKNRRKKIKVKVIAFSLFLRVFTCVCVLASLDDHVARLNHLAHVLRGNCSQDKSRRTYARSID